MISASVTNVRTGLAVLSTRTPPADDGPVGARTVFGRRQRWLLLLAFALLVVCRLPQAWVHGRFLDEEATVFLAYAWHRPWWDALFRPFGGYWNLAANATTLLTVTLVKNGVMPLERAPYLTMGTALAVQLLPAVLILTGRARWLAGRLAVAAALLVIALVPASEEVFYNVLHIQFHLALCTVLILALDVPRGRRARIGYGVLLFLAPLCGPGAIVVLPLFALRALADQDRARLIQLIAPAAGALIQLTLFYGASPMRGHLFDPGTVAATMFVRMIALPALNFGVADQIGLAIIRSQATHGTGWWAAAAATVVVLGTLSVTAARRVDGAWWLVLSSLSIAGVSFGFGMVLLESTSLFRVGAGERYNFLPQVLIGLALVALAMRRTQAWRVYAGLCGLMLLTGAICYSSPLNDFARGPSWPAEVAAWRADHRHPLAVWPAPWRADLSDRPRACSPVGRDPGLSTDPRYCDSGWAAAFVRARRGHLD